ncbi:MAG: zinc-ribbon domain-containing protein [Fusicatenibacter sp.]
MLFPGAVLTNLCWMTMKKMMMTNELLLQWDYEKNGDTDPKVLKRSSMYNAWWRCPVCGGSWQAKVKNRSNGSGCPYCTGRKVLRGFNDLETLYPDIAKEWTNSVHNKKPWEVTPGSHEKVIWECNKGHRWTAEVKSRVAGNKCPYCSGRLAISGKNDLQTLHPELMDEWDWKKNNDTDPSSVTEKSNKKYWWKCRVCGYEWQASPAQRLRTDRKKSSGCPCCNHKVVVPGKNDAATYNPEAAKDWDVELNGGKALSEFLPGSNKYGWWTCHICGQIWKAQIQSRVVNHKGCPYCAGKLPILGKTDLMTTHPELAREWNYKLNGRLRPEQMTEFSAKKVWWKCVNCGYEWRAKIANRVLGRGCPHCAPNRPQ